MVKAVAVALGAHQLEDTELKNTSRKLFATKDSYANNQHVVGQITSPVPLLA